uniref:glycosyltransferase family 4 protein n=1 Tax=Flavobacterium sp. TaxID=239 RepID=UPI004049691F
MKKVLFFCQKTSKKDLEIIEFYNQDIVALKELGYEIDFASNFFEFILKIFKSDFVFIWWWTYAFFPVFIGKLLNKPSVITGTFNFKFDVKETKSGSDYFDRPYYQRLLIKYSVKNANLNLFVNEREKELCSNFFNLSNAEYFPHIISLNYFNEPTEDRQEYILNISWSGKQNLRRKGVFNLIKSFEDVSKKFPNLKLILAGRKGDGYPEMESLVLSLNLQDKIILRGEVTLDEKIELIKNALLYVQPSLYEGFGLAIGEAMASGNCVISCAVGGVPSVLGSAGIYVNPNDIEDLTGKILDILDSKNERKKFEKLAYEKALTDFNPKSKIIKLNQFINKIL